jgi:hypothetical protein
MSTFWPGNVVIHREHHDELSLSSSPRRGRHAGKSESYDVFKLVAFANPEHSRDQMPMKESFFFAFSLKK